MEKIQTGHKNKECSVELRGRSQKNYNFKQRGHDNFHWKMTVEQKSEGSEEVSHSGMWGEEHVRKKEQEVEIDYLTMFLNICYFQMDSLFF